LEAMEELFQGYNSVMRTFKEYKNYPYISQFNDVKTSNNHILLYTRKELILNLDFVLNFVKNAYIQDFDEIENNSSENILEDIKTCVEIFKKKDIDILIVDITKSDVAEAGFSVVKVIIPGMQPLNIDHNYPYLGIKRLYEVPKILGYTQHMTREDDLNKFPHPFP
jgi:ribosomal protein S12 methylthiotransferase accessory factor